MADHSLDIEQLQRTVANLIEEEPESIEPDMNLFSLGLDSIDLMQLVGRWRRAGIKVNFAELAKNPTISAWSRLVPEHELNPVADNLIDKEVDIRENVIADVEFPLAVMQHAYWIGRENGQKLGGVAAHLYTEFAGEDVEPDRLRIAIERLVARHDMLRVQFTDDGKQRIEIASGWRGLTVRDLRDFDHEQATAQLESIRETLSHQMLDIEHGEMFSTALSLLSEGRTRLHVDVDMMAADAVSYRILLADLAHLYEQPGTTLPELHYSYREYCIARPESRSEAARRAAQWWQNRLPDLPGAPELPLAIRSKVEKRTDAVRVTRRHFMLSELEHVALTEASCQRGVTPAMAMATAFAEALGAWSAQPRFLLNVPLFDREPVHPDVGKLLGDFSSSVLP
jgi:mycobactin phenyloxazoline synthetase